MLRISTLALALMIAAPASGADISACVNYDNQISRAMEHVFAKITVAQIHGKISYLYVDEVKTDMHLTYNDNFHSRLSAAARNNPTACEQIGRDGVDWVTNYDKRTDDGISEGR